MLCMSETIDNVDGDIRYGQGMQIAHCPLQVQCRVQNKSNSVKVHSQSKEVLNNYHKVFLCRTN